MITGGCGYEDKVEESVQSLVEKSFWWLTGHLRNEVKINVREVMLYGREVS
jgi:hypothetical protein